MCFVKVKRGDTLLWNGKPVQRVTRYYISNDGAPLIKHAPPVGTEGMFKKANGVSDAQYLQVMKQTDGAWHPDVCTKNKSKYEKRETSIEAGYTVKICNDVKDFDFADINYSWYVSEARKLLV
jgi:hypothetical protein